MKRWHRTVAIVAGLTCFVVVGRRWSAPKVPLGDLPALPSSAHFVEGRADLEAWRADGFVEMVSPIRPPSSPDGRVRILVYVRPTPGRRARTVRTGETWSLELPEGTRADRVELLGGGVRDAEPDPSWKVLDVRGIALDASGPRYRVLRPSHPTAAGLFGIEWARGSLVTDALGELVLRGRVDGPTGPTARAAAAEHLRSLNDCASCHVAQSQPRRTTADPRIPNRGTDASGFYQVASIFQDRLPFETYRPLDTNLGDPYIDRWCGNVKVAASATRCADGTILEGVLDVRTALRNDNLHARRLCRSRRALSAILDDEGRAAFREALEECAGTESL